MASKLAGKNVLVTGAGGFIGSHLAEQLVGQGCNVKALIHYNATNSIGNLRHVEEQILSEIEIVPGDIQDGFFCERLVQGIDITFHLAALIGIPYSYVAPASYVITNIVGTLNLLNASLKHNVDRFLHTSTSEVYGTAIYKPIDEKHPLQGQSPYSATKIGADKLVESYNRSFELPATIVRPFNTFGPRQSLRAVIPTIVSQAIRSSEIRIGSTVPKRDLTFVLDTVNAYIKSAEASNLIGETIHFGTGTFHSIGDVIDAVSRILERQLVVVEDEERIRPEKSEVLELLCDNSQAKQLVGWSPKYDLDSGLREVIDFFERHAVKYAGQYHI